MLDGGLVRELLSDGSDGRYHLPDDDWIRPSDEMSLSIFVSRSIVCYRVNNRNQLASSYGLFLLFLFLYLLVVLCRRRVGSSRPTINHKERLDMEIQVRNRSSYSLKHQRGNISCRNRHLIHFQIRYTPTMSRMRKISSSLLLAFFLFFAPL